MGNDILLAALYIVTVAILIWHGEQRYRHGVWDGAFNQFLPRVRKAMREYDAYRASHMLGGGDD